LRTVAFCQHCADENGNIVNRDTILKGTAGWLKQWSPVELSDAEALRRAELYLLSMPHWAKK